MNNNVNRDNSDARRRARARRARQRRIQRNRRLAALGLILIVIIIAIVTGISSCVRGHKKKNVEDTPQTVAQVDAQANVEAETKAKVTIPYPTLSTSYLNITSSEVLSPYIALIDVENSKVIAGRDYNTKIYPASMTKVMTLIVAVENLKSLDDTFTMTIDIVDPLVKENATRAGFDPGEKVTAKDMLYGLILPSGADASIGLAQMISGSEEAFVKLMNDKCTEMGLTNTHFVNTSGLYDSNHYTTPVEMAMIMEYAMKNETCATVSSAYQYTTASTTQHPSGILLTSTMFSRMYGDEAEGATVLAGKVGYTTEAGNCLVSYAQRGDKHYVAVTAGATNKWHSIFDAIELYGKYASNGE